MKKIVLHLNGKESFFVQESYKVLRTNLLFCGQDIHVVELTSCNENEGKTTVTLNLAKSLAELNKKVLVIDADMRKSVMIGRHTTAKEVTGLSEVLTGLSDYRDCIYETQYSTLHLMFAGKYPPNPVELLNGKYFANLLTILRKEYDYILIDTPPLGAVIDAAVIAPNCDGSIIVMGDKNIYRRQMQDVVDQLEKSGCDILGVIRNNRKEKSRSHYYYRGKNYGYYSKKSEE